MSRLNRRTFLKRSLAAGGRSLAGLTALQAFAACSTNEEPRPVAPEGTGGYGPLSQVGDELALPKGFTYRVIGAEGSTMSDGTITPGRHDGMCAFPLANGNIRLVRNHEVDNNPRRDAAIGDASVAYDPGAAAGTVSLDVHPDTREVIRDFVSLNGTWRNCAGGPTPWGSWLTCEEGFFGTESGFGAHHGYVFEVPSGREKCERTEPLRAMGRFVHEAVAVDPRSGIVYQTEDLFLAGFYRFIPNDPYRENHRGDLQAGGKLQMLAVNERRKYDARTHQQVGRVMPCSWVDIPDPDPQGGPDDASNVFNQGHERGGARFSRLEGCLYVDGSIYFDATDGGDAEFGQIWRYTPTGPDEGTLTLFFESPGQRVLNRPDNLCLSPQGAIVICEDGHSRRQYIRGITPDGRVFDIAQNLANRAELAGATFSPDGRTLFFNIQGDPKQGQKGLTFAMWGPWRNGAA